MTSPTWSAPVRYAEADQQGIVFNSHYLTYCDEAMGAFLAVRGLDEVAEVIRLATSTITWSDSARWGDLVEVRAECTGVGRTSIRIAFDVTAGGRACARAETVYVHADAQGRPVPVPDPVRQALLEPM